MLTYADAAERGVAQDAEEPVNRSNATQVPADTQRELSAYASIRQHTSAHVSICQHTSAYVSTHTHTHTRTWEASVLLATLVCTMLDTEAGPEACGLSERFS